MKYYQIIIYATIYQVISENEVGTITLFKYRSKVDIRDELYIQTSKMLYFIIYKILII